jgi:hypothetical protein
MQWDNYDTRSVSFTLKKNTVVVMIISGDPGGH